ncbi:unnamed protein product [Closterium sp. NIES-53]
MEQVTADLLHLRMGHARRQQLVECVKKGELKGMKIKEGGGQPSKCPDCTTGKLPRTSFPTSTTRASAPLELVHTDVCGPMLTPDREKGSKYFITFLDDFSRLSWVTLLKTKDEVAKVFRRWIRYAEREAGAKSDKEALSRPEWVESMRKELESHKVNESFELVDLACVPPGMEILRCQWVRKYKHKADGSIETPKSRLVAMGNTQTWGVHYDQVFTPVGKPTTLRGSLGMAASFEFHIYHMDVTIAYLHGVLKEELYLRQPPDFDDGSGRVCRLKKSIYGLKQAPR